MSAAVERVLAPAEDPAVRATGLGGTDMAVLAGFGYGDRTNLALWEEKLGLREPEDPGEPAFWGKRLEGEVATVTAERLGVKIARVNSTIRHPQHEFLFAHIDRRIVTSSIEGETLARMRHVLGALDGGRWAGPGRWLLEIKAVNPFVARESWGADWEELPPRVLVQVQHYLRLTGYDGAIVAVLIGGQELRLYFVPRDRDMGEDLVKLGVHFWTQHVLTRVPPAITTYADAKRLFPQHVGMPIAATEAIAATTALYAELKAREKQLAGEIDKTQAEIAAFLGEHETLTVYNDPVLTWRTQTQRRLNEAALKAERPDLYAQYLRESTIRVMRLKGNAK
ncbi:MAG: recombinase [Candidatus Eremiobacteraeota bacterium]|nr:recombinase [Candidatus Eremiobacteraeota bacterium]